MPQVIGKGIFLRPTLGVFRLVIIAGDSGGAGFSAASSSQNLKADAVFKRD
jgi:hypothetical protein